MKIAVSGTHHTGKTTLIDDLSDLLPGYYTFEEPYYQLLDEGYEFPAMPSLEDFELQLKRSIESIRNSNGDCLFDRCPYDILSYLLVHEESVCFDLNGWLPLIEEAMRLLDCVIYVPIEFSDHISEFDSNSWRERVDDELQSLLFLDRWGFAVPFIEATGIPEERVKTVMGYIGTKI